MIGVVVPVVEAITGVPWLARGTSPPTAAADAEPLRVAILATAHTVQSQAYVTEIRLRAPHARVVQQACPNLVEMIEGAASEREIRASVRRYVLELLDDYGVPDVCVLGCTHYPLIEDHFVSELPASVRLLSQPDVTARSLAAYLKRHPQFVTKGAPRRRFLTTGNAAHVSALASRFYGRAVQFSSLTEAIAAPL